MKSNGGVGLQRDFTGFLIYCILHFLNVLTLTRLGDSLL